jgi:hypothetical protein
MKAGNWICLIAFFVVSIFTYLKIREWNQIYDAQEMTQLGCCWFSVEYKPNPLAENTQLPFKVPNRSYTPEYFRIQDLRYLMLLILFGAIPSGGVIDWKKILKTK